MTQRNFLTAGVLVLGLTAIQFLGLSDRISSEDARIISIVFSCILFWATSVIPGLLVSLLFFFLSSVLTSVPTSEIFSGFASSAFWLVFSGGVIGFALNESGLSQRIGTMLARCIGDSYANALLAFAILTFGLSLIMPSTFGRIAILVPVALGYCRVVQLDESSNGQRGILLLVVVGSYELAAAVLPANLPNVIMAGILEQSSDIHLSFSEYLYYFFPAGVLVRGAVLIAVSYKFFHDTVPVRRQPTSYVPISRCELHTIMLLSITLVLWFTDAIHHIAPGWIGLGFSIAYFLTSPVQQLSRFGSTFKMDLLWFVAAIIGLTAIVNHLDIRFLSFLTDSSLIGHPMWAYAILVAGSIGLCFVVTSNAEPSLFIPFAARLLGQSALVKMGMLSQVMGYSTTFLPYQSPPIVFGIELAQIDRAVAVKYCLITSMLGILFVVPINALWWRVISLL